MNSLIVQLERTPGFAIYRVAIGYGLVPLMVLGLGANAPAWQIVVCFLGALLALRIVPAFLRALLPFSREVKEEWFQNRQLAKRYDSYQWRKLLWIGLGMAGYLAVSRLTHQPWLILTGSCLVTGTLGQVLWLKNSVTTKVNAI